MKYESLIFDIDGTLWNSLDLVAEGYNIQMRREGYDRYCTTGDVLFHLFGKVMTDIADALFPDIPKEIRYPLFDRCVESENEYLAQHPCQVGYPNVKETLEALSKRYRLFIVTNGQTGYAPICMEKLGLTPYIQGHLCYGETLTPKGQTIRTLMAKHNIENCVYIGDTQGDYEAAQDAGIDFIWCAYGFGTPAGFVAKIDKIEDLLEL